MFEVCFWPLLTHLILYGLSKIKEPCIAETSEDDCGRVVVAGQSYIILYYIYNIIYYNIIYIYIYIYYIFTENSEYFKIIHFVEHTRMVSLPSLGFYLYYSSVHCFCWYLVLDSFYN